MRTKQTQNTPVKQRGRVDMYPVDLRGKTAVVFGVANHRSIAWAIAKALHDAGARVGITYQDERLKERVEKLTESWDDVLLLECDVSTDDQIARTFQRVEERWGNLSIVIHSVAFALREELEGDFSMTTREGFRTALDISAYSLIPIARSAAPLMSDTEGSIVAMTFQASERVFPGYNIMGTAKAALENEVRQLAYEFGQKGIRVNALSPGPLETLAARGIHGFLDMKKVHAERSPLGRNITHEEVAKAALFLCSDLASGVTGVVLPVDAGYHIMAV
jgi:enoyl-[acyl-carrier protein] reductase I